MPTDPRRLRPSELCRLLNSTPLGEVIHERQLYRHRTRAGMRIGDGRYVDLLRYTAWLIEQRHKPRPAAAEDPYETVKERARARNAALSLAGRDIGQLAGVVNPQRKEQAKTNFRFFCESYFPQTFHLTWSPDHLKVITKIEKAVIEGGLFAMAMPRGSGKTTVCECACIWAVLNGHREFVCLIGSDEGMPWTCSSRSRRNSTATNCCWRIFPRSSIRSSASTASPTAPTDNSSRANARTSAGLPARLCCPRCPTRRLPGRSSRWPASRVGSVA